MEEQSGRLPAVLDLEERGEIEAIENVTLATTRGPLNFSTSPGMLLHQCLDNGSLLVQMPPGPAGGGAVDSEGGAGGAGEPISNMTLKMASEVSDLWER